ncbi:MAG: C4-type zinc ribbon domain-containing protein [Chitinophagales bacterium]|nr:C4-type zinc ribbon domain-containing protein [Chitinophagales bacterium]MDW8394268.1 C4-type zinc ribbon domain-containing protein [Chitinophagales bacterium]
MIKTKETRQETASIEEKLRNLYKLQLIDSKLDQLQVLKGELPMEVKDLEDELAGLRLRIEKNEEEIRQIEAAIANRRNSIKESEALIKKYQKQQSNVKNNREYEALNKEIELQRLEIQLHEKKIREASEQQEHLKSLETAIKKTIKEKEKHLAAKQEELEHILAETEEEEKVLRKKSAEQSAKLEARLLQAYQRIRKTYRNGLAVVTVNRDACGGCFNAIPPQTQLEVRQRKKIIICEHCGRVLVDEGLDQ